MSGVQALLCRLGLENLAPAFEAKGIEKVLVLRKLPAEELRALCSDEASFNKILDAIANRGAPAAQHPAPVGMGASARLPEESDGRPRGRGARGGRGRGFDNDLRGGRGAAPRGGRGFGGRGARYGDGMPQANDNPRPRPTEVLRNHEVTVEISPPELVGVLMAHDCRRLLSIHLKYGTSNDKIDKERDGGGMSVSMVLYGPTEEAVQAAKEEVMREVGIFKKERQDERFQYGLHELQHNLKSVATICAANTRNQGAAYQLSDKAIKALVTSFRFQEQNNITNFTCSSATNDKDKTDLLSECVNKMKGAHVIIFAEPERVKEMSKSGRCQRAFKTANIAFMHRDVPKAERMQMLEDFKNGKENEDGVRTRVLVTTQDYAKLARKIEIPFVNFVVHFTVPKSPEYFLLQNNCCGRNGKPAVSILFCLSNDADSLVALRNSFTFSDFTQPDFERASKGLIYDTVAAPLTTAEADPPANWRELLDEEKAEKEAKKKAKLQK